MTEKQLRAIKPDSMISASQWILYNMVNHPERIATGEDIAAHQKAIRMQQKEASRLKAEKTKR